MHRPSEGRSLISWFRRKDTGMKSLDQGGSLPPLPFESWKETKETLHLFTQIVGKVRLAMHPAMNHWWHAPFYVSPRGLTTASIPLRGGSFEIEFDFIAHSLNVRTSTGDSHSLILSEMTVADFYDEFMRVMGTLGIEPHILAKPFGIASHEPFPNDRAHGTYDRDAAHTFWRILLAADGIFKEFRSRFIGKCSPVHFFWHSFDLAVTRFSGRRAPIAKDADPVTREAYSHEVISCGFWAGDDKVSFPAFYSYVHPEPAGLASTPLSPEAAWWNVTDGRAMALYKYEDFRSAADPKRELLAFLQSAYEAGAVLAGWDRKDLELRE